MEDRSSFYEDLVLSVQGITSNVTFWAANLANASSLIYNGLHSLKHFESRPVNWVGFYVVDPSNDKQLILGPFQGKVACTSIQIGKGVCGTAAATHTTQLVRDVHDFPGHIACDAASNSEIVVPLIVEGRLVGVLDLDCEVVNGYDEIDRQGLEAVAKVIETCCQWPSSTTFRGT